MIKLGQDAAELSRFASWLTVQLVVQRFQADAQLLRGSRFIAVELLQRRVNCIHFNFTQRFARGCNRQCD